MTTATVAKTNLYEGLFLLSQGAVASDFAGAMDHVKEILARAEAEIVAITKWDDRRLAYEIGGARRGAFVLVYFNARPALIANIERDVNLSEQVLRVLIIKADYIGDAELEIIKRDGKLDTEAALRKQEAGRDGDAEVVEVDSDEANDE